MKNILFKNKNKTITYKLHVKLKKKMCDEAFKLDPVSILVTLK